jgi:DNA-binding transcriptional regulator YiaG
LGQLLGIAQRTVVAVFDYPSQRFSPRKLIPVNVKTLGDQLHLRRIKGNLSQLEVAQKLKVSTRTVRKWEHGHICPTEDHWQVLAHLLHLDSQVLKSTNHTLE